MIFTIQQDDYQTNPTVPKLNPRRDSFATRVISDEPFLPRRVKRLVAVAGDRAPAFLPEALRAQHDGVVPVGHIAVAGDNPHSQGSAQFGYVNVDRVESVVIARLKRGRPHHSDEREYSGATLRP